MDTETALSLVEAVVLAKTGKHLSEIESVVLKGAWDGKTYEEMATASGYAVNSLKNDAGPRFWKLLSLQVFGEKVSKANLRAVLERQHLQPDRRLEWPDAGGKKREALALETAIASPRIDWGEAPNLDVFYGRSREIASLQQQITDRQSQLIALLGLRGIGKTTLAVKLVDGIKDQFEQVIWRSLFHDPPPSLSDLLADLLKGLGRPSRVNLPPSSDERISLILEQFQQYRCLVVLDSAEALMQSHSLAGQYKTGYEEYGEFLKRIGMERHQSCVVLTSQECPQEVVELEAQQFPVCAVSIGGLDIEDAAKILAAKGLADEEYWAELINIFQRNPLALQLVSAKIQRSFGGRVSDFLKQKTITTRQIVDLIDQQFQSLSTLEKEITYWLAVRQKPLSFADLRENISISGAVLLDALESLLQRSLIQGEAQFTLEPIVRQYVLNEFKKEALDPDLPHAKESIQQLLERCYERI
jgi:GTPase SAR1 family protein